MNFSTPKLLAILLIVAVACSGESADPDAQPQTKRVYTAEQRAAADLVMKSARAICTIRVEAPHLVVECKDDIPRDRQLEFAKAIADADVIQNGLAPI
jgi:hypothetical protein